MKFKIFLYMFLLLLFISGELEAQESKSTNPDRLNVRQRNPLECTSALLLPQLHGNPKNNFTEEVHDMMWLSLRIAIILNHQANPFFTPKEVKVNLYHFFLAGITEITAFEMPNEESLIDGTLFNILKELNVLEDFQFFLLKQLGFDRNNLGPFKIKSEGGLIQNSFHRLQIQVIILI